MSSRRGRVAICWSGQARIDPPRIQSFVRHIVNPLEIAGHKVDYFCHLWTDVTSPNFNLTEELMIWLRNSFHFTKGRIHPNLKAISTFELSQMNHPHAERYNSQFYSVQRAGELCRSHELDLGFRYDWVVRARLDTHYMTALDVSTLNPYAIGITDTDAHSPELTTWDDTKIVNDQFAIGCSEQMFTYANFLDYMISYQEALISNPREEGVEFMLWKYLNYCQVPFKKIPLTMTLNPPTDRQE